MARHDPEGRTCRARSQRRRRGRPCSADQVRRVTLTPSPVLRPLPLAASDLDRRSLLGGPARLLARRQKFAAPRKLKAIIQAETFPHFAPARSGLQEAPCPGSSLTASSRSPSAPLRWCCCSASSI